MPRGGKQQRVNTSAARVLTLRRGLLAVHSDLFRLKMYRLIENRPRQLSDFEVLVLILEDRRFFGHRGIDWRSVARDLIRALTFRKHGGSSTVDMQFVRTVTGYHDRTMGRKLYEMLLAWVMQFHFTKFEILRSYLDCAFFGSRMKGCHRAAKRAFGKTVSDLSFDEAAQLAAMLVYPRPLVPTANWDRNVRRRADYAKRLYTTMKYRFQKLPIPEH